MTARPRVQQLHQSGATDGQALVWDDAAGLWVPETQLAASQRAPFTYQGTLALHTGVSAFTVDEAAVIESVTARVTTAPTGASILVDVNKNGTTIFTTQANRPAIAASGFTSGSVTNMNVTSLAAGDYLTVDVDQIGSTIPGADLVVVVKYREA